MLDWLKALDRTDLTIIFFVYDSAISKPRGSADIEAKLQGVCPTGLLTTGRVAGEQHAPLKTWLLRKAFMVKAVSKATGGTAKEAKGHLIVLNPR
ncbi:hypothetical protein AOLI_G00218570 [Acnodon oligacanthus]